MFSLQGLENLIPFMLATGQESKLSPQRILEALMIAALTGAISVYATQQVIAVELEGIKKEMSKLEESVNQIRGDIYVPRFKNGESL